MTSFRPLRLAALVFLLQFAVLAATGSLLVSHHDLGWHLLSGETIVASGAIPASDPWSFSAGDFRWINLSWAWDVVAWNAYRLGGLRLLGLLTAALGAATFAIVAGGCLARGAGAMASLVVVFLAGVAVLGYQLPDVAIAAAPQTITLLFTAIVHRTLANTSGDATTSRRLVALSLLMLAWVNLHGGFVVGLAIVGVYLLQAILHRDVVAARRLAAWLAVLVVVCLLNPYGLEVFAGIARSALAHPSSSISEWWPLEFGAWKPAALYLVLFFVGANFRSRSVPLAEKLLSLLWLALGLSSRRHFAIFLVVSPPFLAMSLTPMLTRRPFTLVSRVVDRFGTRRDLGWAALVFAVVVAWFGFGGFRGVEIPRWNNPVEEIRYVAQRFPDKRLFNDWNLGGYILLETRGALKPFIDGRADTAYPPDVTAAYFALSRYEGWQETMDRFGFEVALLPNYRKSMLFYFDAQPEWRLDLRGEHASVYVRELRPARAEGIAKPEKRPPASRTGGHSNR